MHPRFYQQDQQTFSPQNQANFVQSRYVQQSQPQQQQLQAQQQQSQLPHGYTVLHPQPSGHFLHAPTQNIVVTHPTQAVYQQQVQAAVVSRAQTASMQRNMQAVPIVSGTSSNQLTAIKFNTLPQTQQRSQHLASAGQQNLQQVQAIRNQAANWPRQQASNLSKKTLQSVQPTLQQVTLTNAGNLSTINSLHRTSATVTQPPGTSQSLQLNRSQIQHTPASASAASLMSNRVPQNVMANSTTHAYISPMQKSGSPQIIHATALHAANMPIVIPSSTDPSPMNHSIQTAQNNVVQQQPVRNITTSSSNLMSPERRDPIHITFGKPKSSQSPAVLTNQKSLLSISGKVKTEPSKPSTGQTKDDDSDIEANEPSVKVDNTRIVIDDDIEIVGCKEAEVMSHMRADCPIHKFKRNDAVNVSPHADNILKCSKCYCYICDTLATACTSWINPSCPHCNAHSKASCWKARRNMKKSPLMNHLDADETDQEMVQAGELAMKYIVSIREVYITYRAGTPCEHRDVPCECACHRDPKQKQEVMTSCSQCKAVHDLKKKFNYEPVRTVVLDIVRQIADTYHDRPYCAIILFEAVLSEVCSHRPADFNHITRVPSNPNPRCQCNTPQVMDGSIVPELIKIFTLHEVKDTFKAKFLKCVDLSLQPLQLKDIMKSFLQMRHWDDQLLRAVLNGQNTGGRLKSGDSLREAPHVMEWRVRKLDREMKYYAITRYLKVVKIHKSGKNVISDGTQIATAMEKWMLMYLAKQGKFKEVCMRLSTNTITPMRVLSCDFVLSLFSLLAGNDLQPNIDMNGSFNPKGSTTVKCSTYTVTGVDETVLVFVCLIYLEVQPQRSFAVYRWLAEFANRQQMANHVASVRDWVNASTRYTEIARQAATLNDWSVLVNQCQAHPGQVALFTCSLVILQYLTRSPGNMAALPELLAAYQRNEWALFYIFSQPAMLRSGDRRVIAWLADHLTCATDITISQFNEEALRNLVKNNGLADVLNFAKSLIKEDWVVKLGLPRTGTIHPVILFGQVFANKISNEPASPVQTEATAWLSDVIFTKLVDCPNLYNTSHSLQVCEMIGRACVVLYSIDKLDLFTRLFNPAQTQHKVNEIFSIFQQKLRRNLLTPEECALLLRSAIKHGRTELVTKIAQHFVEKHDCTDGSRAILVDELIRNFDGEANQVGAVRKEELPKLFWSFFAHESLAWLICAKCANKMPNGWTEVWRALFRSKLNKELHELVGRTLQQFTDWMKDLNVQTDADIQRLLKCLEQFFAEVFGVLLRCGFPREQLLVRIHNTQFCIPIDRLRNDYAKLIDRTFAKTIATLAPEVNQATTTTVASSAHHHLTNSVQPQVLQTSQQATCNSNAQPPSSVSSLKPVHSLNQPEKSSSSILIPSASVANQPKNPSASIAKPTASIQRQSDKVISSRAPNSGKVVLVKSQPAQLQSKGSPVLMVGSPTTASLRSPTTLGGGDMSPRICANCGDVMSSTFRCSKCRATTGNRVDIKCPGCGQMNRDLKGYSCKFCYVSLLEVLTSNGDASPSPNTTSATTTNNKAVVNPPAKEQQATCKVPAVKNKVDVPAAPSPKVAKPSIKPKADVSKPVPTAKSVSEDSAVVVISSGATQRTNSVIKPSPHHNLPKSSPPRQQNSIQSSSPPPRLSNHISNLRESLKQHMTPEPPKVMGSELPLKRKPKRPLTQPIASLSETSSSSSEDDDNDSSNSDSDFASRMPPIKRKSHHSDDVISSVTSSKRRAAGSSTDTSPRAGSTRHRGSAMSKKQRSILERIAGRKSSGSPKTTLKLTKSSRGASWECELKRGHHGSGKPGPASRTGRAANIPADIHPAWTIPSGVRLPTHVDLSRRLAVSLGEYPPEHLKKVNIIRRLKGDTEFMPGSLFG